MHKNIAFIHILKRNVIVIVIRAGSLKVNTILIARFNYFPCCAFTAIFLAPSIRTTGYPFVINPALAASSVQRKLHPLFSSIVGRLNCSRARQVAESLLQFKNKTKKLRNNYRLYEITRSK